MRARMIWLMASLMACKSGEPIDDPGTPPVDDTDELRETDVETDADTDPPLETGETDLPSMGTPAEVELSGVITCPDPGMRATRRGRKVEAREQELLEGEYNLRGGAVAAADFNGDGRIDLFFPGIRERQMHMQQVDGSFRDEAETRLAGVDLPEVTGVSLADYDADGDLDLFVTAWNLPHKLLVNDGAGFFTDGTAAAGLTGTPRRYQASVWGDLDRDGDLDLVVGGYGPEPVEAHAPPEGFEIGDRSEVFRNNGDGTFTEISEIFSQEVHDSHTFMLGFHDLDLDGWDELLVINDFGWNRPSRIFWNRATGLEMDDGAAGFDIPFAGMGLGVGDINGDEVPDFAQSSWKEASLLVSAGGAWWESAEAAGILPDHVGLKNQVFGWGTELTDLDNDGDQDLLINYGWWDDYGPHFTQTDAAFFQTQPGVFVDDAEGWGMADTEVSRGIVTLDINGDGWIDVVKRLLDGKTPMYLSNCGGEGWLVVSARAPAPNTYAIGARVRVIAGDKVLTRQIHAGGTGMYSAYEPQAHFGLGDLDRVDRVEIIWPGGDVTTLTDVDTRQRVRVTRLP
jgi:hypothetical protein